MAVRACASCAEACKPSSLASGAGRRASSFSRPVKRGSGCTWCFHIRAHLLRQSIQASAGAKHQSFMWCGDIIVGLEMPLLFERVKASSSMGGGGRGGCVATQPACSSVEGKELLILDGKTSASAGRDPSRGWRSRRSSNLSKETEPRPPKERLKWSLPFREVGGGLGVDSAAARGGQAGGERAGAGRGARRELRPRRRARAAASERARREEGQLQLGRGALAAAARHAQARDGRARRGARSRRRAPHGGRGCGRRGAGRARNDDGCARARRIGCGQGWLVGGAAQRVLAVCAPVLARLPRCAGCLGDEGLLLWLRLPDRPFWRKLGSACRCGTWFAAGSCIT